MFDESDFLMFGTGCSKLKEVVSKRDVKINILKYGKYIDMFAEKNVSSFYIAQSFAAKVFDFILATTITEYVINELVKLTML